MTSKKETWSRGTNSRFSFDVNVKLNIREIKIHIYGKRQASDSSWEFLRIENKEIKTVPNDSYD